MKNKSGDKLLSELENKLDVFIEKGLHLSKDLTLDDREKVMMKVINELIETAMMNVREENISEEKLIERRKQIVEIIKKHYERKIKEYKKKKL